MSGANGAVPDAAVGAGGADGNADGGTTDSADGAAPPAPATGLSGFYAGTNVAGADFNGDKLPGVAGQDYTYPSPAEIDYFTGKGFKIIRIPFLWERLQPVLDQELDSGELGRLKDVADYVTSKGALALLDPHDYARYRGGIVGSNAAGAATAAQFGTFWNKLATVFASNKKVIFGLMNEPSNMATELWLSDANAAISAIRAGGATNTIFVPGNGWTGAHSWTDNYYGTPNATVMLGIKDPLDNFVYEVHQYLDSDFSGTHPDCVSATIGSESLKAFTDWLVKNHARGFLGEFGTADNPTCAAALDDMLGYMDQHRDVWLGYTWWAAGAWWGSYMYSLEPDAGKDKPQLATLLKHL